MSPYYILDGKTPKPAADALEWARAFQSMNRRVAEDFVGDVHVSTVFLGIDHNWGQRNQPVLFETMVFGGKYDQEQERYCTWDEAEAGHQRWLAKVKESEEWPSEI